MAYLRLGNIKAAKKGGVASGLKRAINYIYNPDKTEQNRFVGGYNLMVPHNEQCSSEAFNQMISTKRGFGKMDKRQGYHYKLSFPSSDTITPDMAMKVTEELCRRVLSNYECAYAVHTNTAHLHSHIVFNSVGFDGYKYRYEPGDWKNIIQPVVNDICKEYGLDTLNLEVNQDVKIRGHCKKYNSWMRDNKIKNQSSVYPNRKIKEDVDECISKASDYSEFVSLMKAKGHIYNDRGKYITVTAPGRQRATRIINLTADRFTYTKENINNMILGIYLNREDVKNRMFEDWNKYNNGKKNTVKKCGIDIAKFMEEKEMIIENGITGQRDINELGAYLSATDRELNILRKHIYKSLQDKDEAYAALDEMIKNHFDFRNYQLTGDDKYKGGYDKCITAYHKLEKYDIYRLYKYREDANNLIAKINDYKKHVYVNKKILERIKDKTR